MKSVDELLIEMKEFVLNENVEKKQDKMRVIGWKMARIFEGLIDEFIDRIKSDLCANEKFDVAFYVERFKVVLLELNQYYDLKEAEKFDFKICIKMQFPKWMRFSQEIKPDPGLLKWYEVFYLKHRKEREPDDINDVEIACFYVPNLAAIPALKRIQLSMDEENKLIIEYLDFQLDSVFEGIEPMIKSIIYIYLFKYELDASDLISDDAS